MGKSIRNTDDGLPILGKDTSISATTDDGLPIIKKKDGTGSVSPSDSSPKQEQTAPPVDTSGSAPKQVTANYKNNSITPKDLGDKPLGQFTGPSPDQISHAINNKGKNIDKWSKAPSDNYVSALVNQHKEVQDKISQLDNRDGYRSAVMSGNKDSYEADVKNLKDRESYLRTEIQKNYDARKPKIVSELVSTLKDNFPGANWVDVYNNETKDASGETDVVSIDSPLKWDKETNKLTPKSVKWIQDQIDPIMNKKKDPSVNATVSGDLDDKPRTYADLTKAVVDQLNLVPVQKAQQDFTEDYIKKNPGMKDALSVNKDIHDYFSKNNFDDVKAKVNVQADKDFIATQERYFGKEGVFQKNQDFLGIQHKYAQLVADNKMTEAVAKKQIEAEINENPALKKIKENFDTEKRKIVEKTQKQYEDYVIGGLKKDHPQYTTYKDGSIGLASLSEDQYTNMMEGYQEGMDKVAKKVAGDQALASFWKSNIKAQSYGPLLGSLAAESNELAAGLTKMFFNKTGWGGAAVRNFQADEIAGPNINQSDVAATWNLKGWESLLNPDFYLSGVGKMVPVIAGGAAISLATEGEATPAYVEWLANAGLFTAQSSLSTYNQLLNTKDANGNMLSEADAAHSAADQAAKDFLPNVLMMAVGSGTLLRAKNIVKPTITRTLGKGAVGVAAQQPFFAWQGYNDYATMQEAEGKKTDIYDYLQSKDFRDNLLNGMIMGGAFGLIHAPGSYKKSMDNWEKMVHTSEGEFKNLIPQNYALTQEMAGNGNYLRDALKLHIFNTDPSTLNEDGKRNLTDLKNALLYSVNLDKNIKNGNLDRRNINDFYEAHNLSLADQHDYLSEEAAKQGNNSLSEVYKDKAKGYREEAKSAANGQATYFYLANDEGNPIFMTEKSFKTLEEDGIISKWMNDGTISKVGSNDDPDFSQRYSEFIQAKTESIVEGKDLSAHLSDLIEENRDKLGVYYAVAKDNPEAFYKEVSDQVFGRNADGSVSLRPDAEIEARIQYGDDIVDMAKMMHPNQGDSELKYNEAKGEDVQDVSLKGKKYKSEMMSPDDYIKETGGYESTFIDQKKVDKIKEKIKNGVPLDPLTLTSKEGANVGQEGRHRAEAAKQLGIKEIPVVRIEGELEAEGSAQGEYKPNIRDDYFAQSDFFGPEEKEKFAALDEAGQDKMIDKKRAELKAVPEDNISVGEMMGKQVVYKGKRGMLVEDGKVTVFKPEDGGKEYELGNTKELADQSAKELGVGTEKSVVDADKEGDFTVRGKKYINPFEKRGQDPTDAILYDKEGNVVNVRMKTPEGERRTFTGPVAEDLAYQIHLKQISDNNEQPALEEFINSDEPTRKEIEDGGPATATEEKSTVDTEKIQGEPNKEVTISSPIKTESDEKTKEAEGRQGDVLTPKEGADKPNSMKDEAAAPSSPLPRQAKESPKEEFTAVRKEKLREIKGTKQLFERQKTIKWTETYDNALSNLQAMYPDKGLYDAMKARIGHFTAMLDSSHLFNPTSEDIAVFNVFRDETKRRINEIPGWDSTDNIQRLAAVAEFTVLQKDLFDIARVTNPGGEAGRAFNLLQSEVAQDPESGLKIRRMELLGAKGGGKLTEEEMAFTADNWEKEKALLQKEQELKQRGMQEKFDQQIGKVRDDYEKKLAAARSEKKPVSEKAKREKLLSEKGSELAEKIRSGKLKGTYATFPGLPQAINVVLEGIARLVEGGYSLAQAIDEYVQANKIKNKDQFQNDLFEVFNKQERQEDTYAKISEIARATGTTDVTKEMAGKNLIKDYLDSHVGLHDPKDVLDVAYNELKKILPDLEKERLTEAYLKQGDFKQPTKNELESGFKQSQKNFEKLVKLEQEINDLNEKGDIYKKSKNKTSPYDKDIEAKEKEKKAIMNSMGIKTSGEDKYTKASYDQRAKAHNDRLGSLSQDIEDRIQKGDLSDKSKSALIKLKNQLEAAAINIDPTSAQSQSKTLDGGLSVLKAVKSEFQRSAMEDPSKIGGINRTLQKIIDQFSTDKDESEQNVKLQRAKDQAKRESEKYFQQISNGEYEDRVSTPLTKTDAELIKLQRDRDVIAKIYQDKKDAFDKKNKSGTRRFFDFARAAMVDYLIGSPMTVVKVAGSAVIRPQLEAATKLTFGKGFEALPFETTRAISERAKAGGESQSLKSIKKGYEAYLRQYSEKQTEALYEKANAKYEDVSKKYDEAQAEENRIKFANGKDSPEYEKASEALNKAKQERDEALIDAIGNSVYQFIGGSSIKEAAEVLIHRSTQMERQFGDFDREALEKFKKTNSGKEHIATALDNMSYVMNFVGRSHAALKNFSARQSFAAGFMARLEYAVNNGVDISQPDRILEMANESYHDFERGKYQESNWITDTWNKVTNSVERVSPEMAYLMRADVAITRVPVNMLREGIMEYTLGAFRGSVMAAREYYKAKGIVLQDGFTPESEAAFRQELREQLDKIDPDKAATIVRAFRKGGFGLGLYSLALLGNAAFGGWPHKGQTAEDKKKKQREEETEVPEIKTGEIKWGDYQLPEWVAKVVEHTPAFAPAGFGLGMSQVYKNNIIDGKSTLESSYNSAMGQINHIIGSLPMIDKVVQPLAVGAIGNIIPKGQWDDVDTNGNPMKRHAFHATDYFNYLPGYGDKKDILSEGYYKQAVATQRGFRQQITEVETNTSLSKKEKEEQRSDLLKEMEEAIDDIYKANKEDPQ